MRVPLFSTGRGIDGRALLLKLRTRSLPFQIFCGGPLARPLCLSLLRQDTELLFQIDLSFGFLLLLAFIFLRILLCGFRNSSVDIIHSHNITIWDA